MFGLEEKEKELFEFDLEQELKKNPDKKAELSKEAECAVEEIKSLLRTGIDTNDFDDYGVLLHGYSALLKTLTRISPAKKGKTP
jgi:hypothetical protein